ncbi:MAG: twin-arginine translocation signal domain-containing protein [Nitrospinae bacterium]|nr:twin-arginine translocation signal domain-containing protein [Nitrospinota bacterium]
MEHGTKLEKGVSRRKFLKLSGLFGLALGALSWPSLGWGETSPVASESAEEEKRLAHRVRRRGKVRSRRRARARAARRTGEARGTDSQAG